jgi:diguanylate cyclase (GGDEF)-like protein
MRWLNKLVAPSLTKRLALVIGAALLAITSLTVWFASTAIDADLARSADARAAELSGNLATNLNFRLLTVDAIIENAAAGDAVVGSQLIEQRLRRFQQIKSVVIQSWSQVFADRNLAPVHLSVADQQLLKSNKSKLISQVVNGELRALYAVRVLKIGGTAAVLFCEIDPVWLWRDMAIAEVDSAVAVLDRDGQVLHATSPLPASLLLMLRAAAPVAEPAAVPAAVPAIRTWSDGRGKWRGVVTEAQVDGAAMVSDRWQVVSYRQLQQQSPGFAALRVALPLLVIVALALATLAVLYLRAGWYPVLDSLRRALADLGAGRYTPVQLGRSVDTPRLVAADFNGAIAALQRRVQSLANLNEIDRLLLQSGQIEQSLDNLLRSVCGIATCHSAALALLEPNAQAYARAYAVAAGGRDQPVSRIAVNSASLGEIGAHVSGMSVTRGASSRYGFLEPLRTLGAEFFWAWPVLTDGKLVAVLSIGYLGLPDVSAELTTFGTECAARIGVALSKGARDEALYHQAHYDPLTSLPNRLLFGDRLAQELASPQRGALLYIDLDHFKKVNDSVGHAGGDQLLQIVAQRLKACVKEGDTVARLSGDEFTVILRNVSAVETARATATRIIDTLQQPVAIAGRDHLLCASVGVTMFPDDGNSLELLTRNADLAMYQAKESGRGRVVFYTRAMEGGQGPVLESSLLRALRKQEFLLHYQPQYSLADGSMVGVEALLRWQPPRQPLRMPAEFIGLAEECGLIVELGAWVIDTACMQLAAWRKQGIAPPRVAINVSVHQLRQADFPALVRRAIMKAQVPPEMIELEITESVFADDDAREALKRLAAIGVRLALDDFGTGYSSLGFLREHPVQLIKIDRSFIEDVVGSPTAATLAETIISMAHALGKQVLAEGVETLEQLEFLRHKRCDAAQGFFFSRPRAVNEITEIMLARSMQPGELIRSAG